MILDGRFRSASDLSFFFFWNGPSLLGAAHRGRFFVLGAHPPLPKGVGGVGGGALSPFPHSFLEPCSGDASRRVAPARSAGFPFVFARCAWFASLGRLCFAILEKRD